MQASSKWPEFEAKMKAKGLSEAAIAAFKSNYDQLVGGETGLVGAPAAVPGPARSRSRCLVG